jgi:hypothetical protein
VPPRDVNRERVPVRVVAVVGGERRLDPSDLTGSEPVPSVEYAAFGVVFAPEAAKAIGLALVQAAALAEQSAPATALPVASCDPGKGDRRPGMTPSAS